MDVFEADNPNGIGMIRNAGLGRGPACASRMRPPVDAGNRFPVSWPLSRRYHYRQIDDTASQLGRRAMVDMALVGDVKTTVKTLLPMIAEHSDRSFLDDMLALHRDMLRIMAAPLSEPQNERALSPEQVANAIDELADKNAIFTVDTGMCNIWSARYLNMKKDQRLLASFGHGSMANALPQAIGAALAAPDRQVIALCGDGGLTMLMGELLTAVEQNLPVKLMVFNNSSRAMVHREMHDAGIEPWGAEVKNPDFGAVARANGAVRRKG